MSSSKCCIHVLCVLLAGLLTLGTLLFGASQFRLDFCLVACRHKECSLSLVSTFNFKPVVRPVKMTVKVNYRCTLNLSRIAYPTFNSLSQAYRACIISVFTVIVLYYHYVKLWQAAVLIQRIVSYSVSGKHTNLFRVINNAGLLCRLSVYTHTLIS